MPDDVTPKGNDGLDGKPGGKKKKAQNYKWYLIGGLAVLAVLVFYFTNRSNSNAAAAQSGSTAQDMNNLPMGGVYPPATPYGGGYYGGGRGPRGPAGPPGPRGKPGPNPKGKKPPNHKVAGTYFVNVTRNESLSQLASARHWDSATLKWVETHDHLTPSSRLKRGTTVTRPHWG